MEATISAAGWYCAAKMWWGVAVWDEAGDVFPSYTWSHFEQIVADGLWGVVVVAFCSPSMRRSPYLMESFIADKRTTFYTLFALYEATRELDANKNLIKLGRFINVLKIVCNNFHRARKIATDWFQLIYVVDWHFIALLFINCTPFT